jgi:DnaK suppressor protein
MDLDIRKELAEALHREREALLAQFFDVEADLRTIAEDREPELEERAQEERTAGILAGLDDRSLREIASIDGALARMNDGTYGTCLDCGEAITLARLRALPTATLCIDCARRKRARA